MHTRPHTASHFHEKAQRVKPSYESGMKITYDAASKRTIVAFRGRITVLPETYEFEAQGIAAGELYCRRHRWDPHEQAAPAKNSFRSLY